jgi:DNA ligase-associated metallophosphoesterase
VKFETIIEGISLLPERALFIQKEKALVLADLHFGKINHFRKAGLPVPTAANKKNAEALIDLLNKFNPRRVIFLGDLFHSHYNDEWEVVGQIIRSFPACAFDLIRGNHDIMSELQYERNGIAVSASTEISHWVLTHEPMEPETILEGKINMAGHLHPGARLYGRGRQSLILPCFWFSKHQLILPAFGSFTGLAAITPAAGDRVHIIFENKIMEVTPYPADQPAKIRR